MVTDRAPQKPVLMASFLESDRNRMLRQPQDERAKAAAKAMESALETGPATAVRKACAEFVRILADFYQVEAPGVRVLAARPIRTREGDWASELFGDYHPNTRMIGVWMRTAVRKQVTSFGTFLSTLCHEFCHHLDYERFKYGDSWHTRGFYERAAALYHHARGTPPKPLLWVRVSAGRWRIDWQRTNRGS